MSKSNFEHLKVCLEKNEFSQALEFAEAMGDEYTKLQTDCDEWESECNTKDERIVELEKMLEEYSDLTEIQMGIGSIWYKTDGNLKLEQIMDDFKERIQLTSV